MIYVRLRGIDLTIASYFGRFLNDFLVSFGSGRLQKTELNVHFGLDDCMGNT